jgi:hypothetical protein
VSSWKGPELERVSKVRLVERFRINFGTRSGLANAIFFLNRRAPNKPQCLSSKEKSQKMKLSNERLKPKENH